MPRRVENDDETEQSTIAFARHDNSSRAWGELSEDDQNYYRGIAAMMAQDAVSQPDQLDD